MSIKIILCFLMCSIRPDIIQNINGRSTETVLKLLPTEVRVLVFTLMYVIHHDTCDTNYIVYFDNEGIQYNLYWHFPLICFSILNQTKPIVVPVRNSFLTHTNETTTLEIIGYACVMRVRVDGIRCSALLKP